MSENWILPAVDAVEPDMKIDVLVVGAGGCGLVAAIAAHEVGVEVAIVEKADVMGGNTCLSSGSIPGAGTRFQRALGIEDDGDSFAVDLLAVSGQHDAEHLTRLLAGISSELVEWLVDSAHVELELIGSYKHVGHSVNRLHAPRDKRGETLMADLLCEVERREIPIAFGNAARRLIADGCSVLGVETLNNQGESAVIGATATILAVNGFGRNRELLRQYCPAAARANYAGASTSEGEALHWGVSLGARTGNLGAYQGHASFADPHGVLTTWTLVEKGGIVIDSSGGRFADESMGYSAFAEQELQRTGPFYVVYDSAIRNKTAASQPEYRNLVEMGAAVAAPNVESLARRIGVSAEALEATVRSARAAAVGEVADLLGRKNWGDGPLSDDLCATRVAPALFHTQGGLFVDEKARVLCEDSRVIGGLFAGGGAAVGISGHSGSTGYVSGNGLLSALGLGLIAGRAAAREVIAVRKETLQ